MSSTQEQISPRRKRQADDLFESQPSKRLKPSIKLHSAEFYDSLSQVWLTRRALKEFDRRTSHISQPSPVAPYRRGHQGVCKTLIQRFARHGGPDLRNLRGVGENCQSLLIIANLFSIHHQESLSLHTR